MRSRGFGGLFLFVARFNRHDFADDVMIFRLGDIGFFAVGSLSRLFDAEVLAAAFTVFLRRMPCPRRFSQELLPRKLFAVLAAELFAVLDAFSLAVLGNCLL